MTVNSCGLLELKWSVYFSWSSQVKWRICWFIILFKQPKYLHLHWYCCLSSSEGHSRWGPPRTDPHWTRWRRWGGWWEPRWRRAQRSLVLSLGQITKSDGYFSLNHKKFLFSSLFPPGLIWAFSSRLHCVKFVARLSRVPTGAAVIMRGARGTTLITARDIGTTTQHRPGEQCWCFAGVHLSVVLTFALSLCYWRMSNAVGCLELSNYEAICQDVGRHLNYKSFGRWHEEVAY